VDSVVIIVLQTVKKQVEGKIAQLGIKEQKIKETREQLKVVKQGRSSIPADILEDI